MSHLQETLYGLPLDTVIILACHFLCLPLAIWFSRYKPQSQSVYVSRENISSLAGVVLVICCYGWESVHLLLHWFISYIILVNAPRHKLGIYTFAAAFSHVLLCNVYKFIYCYGEFPIDYVGTLMLGTMKVTSLAFSIEDAQKPHNSLTEYQKKNVVHGEVTLREHFDYYFSFVGILFGPFIFYNDHKKYMSNKSQTRSNNTPALATLLYGLACVAIYLLATPEYDVTRNSDEDVLGSGFLYRHWILYVTMFVARCKYYFVWLTSQAICMFAGVGGAEDDDVTLTATVNPLKIELATSLKQFIDNWNIFTARWLRFVCYERVPKNKALITFVISAVWHGFYPGYLMMFVPLAFYTIVGQKLHKVVRPKFQSTQWLRVFYAIITWCGATITVFFNGTAFQLLYFSKIIEVQQGLYYYPHMIAVVLFICLPTPRRNKLDENKNSTNGTAGNHMVKAGNGTNGSTGNLHGAADSTASHSHLD